jgi:hypothetical protein
MTSAPTRPASSAVPSLEPSSTTITAARHVRTSWTNGSMVAASFKHGITAAHRDGKSIGKR